MFKKSSTFIKIVSFEINHVEDNYRVIFYFVNNAKITYLYSIKIVTNFISGRHKRQSIDF